MLNETRIAICNKFLLKTKFLLESSCADLCQANLTKCKENFAKCNCQEFGPKKKCNGYKFYLKEFGEMATRCQGLLSVSAGFSDKEFLNQIGEFIYEHSDGIIQEVVVDEKQTEFLMSYF